ncbi:Nucleoside-diphosphate-sugar epimerase [Lachnospiraceae bacterium XBB1006]|nr:Nucleoside-diphosphate-sugar epimerase [Lachnospiraceae bacterium XBB1006]
MKTVVITGATGCVGRALVDVCIAAGYEVLAVLNRNTSRGKSLESLEHCHILYLSLNEYKNAMSEIEKQHIRLDSYELFFHLAWMSAFGVGRDDVRLQLSNVEASIDAVGFAKELGCTTFIGAGSQAEYGRTEGKLAPHTPTFPETGYGIAKLCTSQMTRILCEQFGMRSVWCRILSAYGPYDAEKTLIREAITKMLKNVETEFSPCEQTWDYIYADDAARALLVAGEYGENGGIYVVGSGESHRLSYYIDEIARITEYTKEIGYGKRGYNPKQVMNLQADISAIEELGFKVAVSFAEGIQRVCSIWSDDDF